MALKSPELVHLGKSVFLHLYAYNIVDQKGTTVVEIYKLEQSC